MGRVGGGGREGVVKGKKERTVGGRGGETTTSANGQASITRMAPPGRTTRVLKMFG